MVTVFGAVVVVKDSSRRLEEIIKHVYVLVISRFLEFTLLLRLLNLVLKPKIYRITTKQFLCKVIYLITNIEVVNHTA